MAKVSKAEYGEQLARLKEWIKPGDTIYTILEHVSRSGMQRTIRTLIPAVDQRPCDCHSWPEGEPHYIGSPRVDFLHPNYAVSVVTGYSLDKRPGYNGVKIGGCGMDMGFALVEHVSSKLYGGKRCDCGFWVAATKDLQCSLCKGSGNVIGTGYQCLGKGKCPSNYHVNHRDRIRCDGHGEGDARRICYKPDRFSSRYPVPEGWPTLRVKVGKGEYLEIPAACLTDEGGENPQICPTCKGKGDLPNPEGPERFDLEHFDGYAIKQRWL